MAHSAPKNTASARDSWIRSPTCWAKVCIYPPVRPGRAWASNWSIISPWRGRTNSQMMEYAAHTGQ